MFSLAGESGSYLYVAAEGDYEVIKEGRVLGSLGAGKAFGELAILYNCRRTASIKAVTEGKVWALERKVFQQIMVSSGLKKMENQVRINKIYQSDRKSINREKCQISL